MKLPFPAWDHVPDHPSSDTGLTGVLLVHIFLPVKEESLHPANCVIGDRYIF